MSVTPGIADGVDPSERLSADDMATQREGQFLAAALQRQQRAAQAVQRAPGVCANCGDGVSLLMAYCDDECRADHEHRQMVLARQGRRA
jgi:hypothetical protein